MWRLLFLLLSFNAVASCPLEDGDLVFIKSQSEQSKLLRIVTDSEWTHMGMAFKDNNVWHIIEAVQPVRWTSIASFIKRSNQGHFEIMRANFSFDSSKVKAYAEAQLNKNYDLIFSMDQERFYCSELVWKAYQKGAKEEIGHLEKIGDLKVDDIQVMNEVTKRFADYGLSFNADEWKKSDVITPPQMMKSEKVSKVVDQTKIEQLQGCITKKRN